MVKILNINPDKTVEILAYRHGGFYIGGEIYQWSVDQFGLGFSIISRTDEEIYSSRPTPDRYKFYNWNDVLIFCLRWGN